MEPTITVHVSTLGRETLMRLLDSIADQRLIEGDEVYVVVDRAITGGGGPHEPIKWPGGMPAQCVGDTPETYAETICPTCMTVAVYNTFGLAAKFGALHHEDHCWGHPQRNWLLDKELSGGDLIVANDDDDVFNPGAFDAIRSRAQSNPGRVLLFRFTTVGREVLWKPGEFRESRYGGHGIVVPNVAGKIGRWGRRYAGDWDYITSTIALCGGVENAVFCDEIIATARPDS